MTVKHSIICYLILSASDQLNKIILPDSQGAISEEFPVLKQKERKALLSTLSHYYKN